MKILSIEALIVPTKHGYIIGIIQMLDGEKQLMYDENMYFTEKKFWRVLKQKFINNTRFELVGKIKYSISKKSFVFSVKDSKL